MDFSREPDIIAGALRRPRSDVFLRERNLVYTMGDLRSQARRIAQLLSQEVRRSPSSGERPPVGVYVASYFSLTACVLGCWEARCLPVLVDPASKGEIGHLTGRHAGILFLSERDHMPATSGIPLPDFELDRDAPPAGDTAPSVPALGEPCVGYFTSGSEGLPKLVPKIGRQVFAHVAAASEMLSIPPACRTLSLVPPFHILGFAYGILAPLRAGGETCIVTDQLPALMREAILSFRPQVVVATAVHYRFLNSVLLPADDLPEAVYISSGAPLNPGDRDEFESRTGRLITELYGSTETAGIAWRRGEGPWVPYPGVEFKVQSDHLWVKSPWAHREDADAYVETHDVAEPEGESFRLLGRSGEVVKVGGRRFSSLEVERVLRAHPGVQDAAVVPADRRGEPALAAFVVLAPGSATSVSDLRRHLDAQLASFKVPRIIRILVALPRKKLGKLDYAELRELAGREN